MSIKLMQLVWDLPLDLSPKMLLLSLADQANDAGECYPSTKTLARRIGASQRTVFRALANLDSDGYIDRMEMGGQRTLYVLNEERLRQLNLPNPCQIGTGDKLARVTKRQVTPDKLAVTPCQIGTPIKQPPLNPKEPPPGARRAGKGQGDQLGALPEFDRKLIEPYLGGLHASIDLSLFADFVKHRQVCKRPLSISSWNVVRVLLNTMAKDGHDLNESLRQTMAKGLSEPIAPRVDPGGPSGFRPQQTRANDDFSQVNYGPGTAPSDLPKFLQSADDISCA